MKPPATSVQGLVLENRVNVHQLDPYGRLLADHIRYLTGSIAIDLTCGSGVHAILLGRRFNRVVAVDISYAAVSLTLRNAALNGVSRKVMGIQGDLFSAISHGVHFDAVVAWPPVMPTPPARLHLPLDHTNEGGPDGRNVFDRILRSIPERLSKKGSFWTIHPWYLDFESTKAILIALRLRHEIIRVARFPLGRLSGARLAYIRSLGMVPPVHAGHVVQLMTVLRIERG